MRHPADRRLDVSLRGVLPQARARRAACRSIATPSRIGLRFPVEVGPGRRRAQDAEDAHRTRSRRTPTARSSSVAQRRKREWPELLRALGATTARGRLTPGQLARELGRRLRDDALVAWDSGHNTGVLARYVDARGTRCSPAPACWPPWLARFRMPSPRRWRFPGRQVVAFTGDGGLTMLLGELATIVRYGLPIKIVVMKNNYAGPDQVGAAHVPRQSRVRMRSAAHRLRGRRAGRSACREFAPPPTRISRPASTRVCGIRPRAASKRSSIPNEPLLPPKRMPKYVENLEKALNRGTAGAEDIRAALEREPAHTQLS